MKYWNEPRHVIHFWKVLTLPYLEKLILIPEQQSWSQTRTFFVADWKIEVFGIALQCSGFITILDMIISVQTELKTYWIWSNSKHSIKCKHLAISFLLAVINM